MRFRENPEKRALQEKEKSPDNVVPVDTPEARYKVVYGYHTIEQEPTDIGKSDAIFLEKITKGGDYSTPESAEKLLKEYSSEPQYRQIILEAERQKKPIFFGDIIGGDLVVALQHGLRDIEPVVGALLLASLTKKAVEQGIMNMDRREFLKKALGGIFLLSQAHQGLGALLEAGKNPGFKFDRKGAMGEIDKFLTKLNEKIHPETNAIVLTMRNALNAKKIKEIAKLMEKEVLEKEQAAKEIFEKEMEKRPGGARKKWVEREDKRPEVAIVMGAWHRGIEDALLDDEEELIELVDELLGVPGLEETRKKIATIARFDFDEEENKWKARILKDRKLTEIEK